MTARRGSLLRAAGVTLILGLLVTGCGGDGTTATSPGAGTTSPATASAYVLPSCPELPHRSGSAGGLPDLNLPCLGDGPAVRLSDLRGIPTVLNVWAAWCTICDEEMPVLAKGMHQAGDRVRFFGVHYSAPAGYGKRSAADFGVPFPSVQDTDGDKTTLALRIQGPPTTLFFAADGSLAGRKAGAIKSLGELDQLVRRYLGVRL